MKPLTTIERQALEPGPPGESMPDSVLTSLIERGLAAWVPCDCGDEGCGTEHRFVFMPTELGELALRLPK